MVTGENQDRVNPLFSFERCEAFSGNIKPFSLCRHIPDSYLLEPPSPIQADTDYGREFLHIPIVSLSELLDKTPEAGFATACRYQM